MATNLKKPLGVSNEFFNKQLLNVLKPGTNITFDTTNPGRTTVNATGGGGGGGGNVAPIPFQIPTPYEDNALLTIDNSNIVSSYLDNLVYTDTPDELDINLDSQNKLKLSVTPKLKIYKNGQSFTSNDLIYNGGHFYSADAISNKISSVVALPTPLLSIADCESYTSATSVDRCVLQTTLPGLHIQAEAPNIPTLTSNGQINSVPVQVITFTGGQNLAMSASSYPNNAIQVINDYTIVLVLKLASNIGPAQTLFAFEGNSNIYSMNLATSAMVDKLVFKIGTEQHTFPSLVNSPMVLIIRMSAVNSLAPTLSVFVNNTKIYSALTQQSDLSQGIGGRLSIGSAANVNFGMDLYSFQIFEGGLSDQDCSEITNILGFLTNNSLTALPIASLASYDATSIGHSSVPVPGKSPVEKISVWNCDNPSATLVLTPGTSRPLYSTDSQYQLDFSGNGEIFVQTTGLDGAVLSAPFSVMLGMRILNSNIDNPNYSSVLSLSNSTAQTQISVLVKTSTDSINFKLQPTNDGDSSSLSVSKVANKEIILFLNVQENIVGLGVFSLANSGLDKYQACSAYNSGLTFVPDTMVVGKKGTTSAISYSVGFLNIFPRALTIGEQLKYKDSFCNAKSLPYPSILA